MAPSGNPLFLSFFRLFSEKSSFFDKNNDFSSKIGILLLGVVFYTRRNFRAISRRQGVKKLRKKKSTKKRVFFVQKQKRPFLKKSKSAVLFLSIFGERWQKYYRVFKNRQKNAFFFTPNHRLLSKKRRKNDENENLASWGTLNQNLFKRFSARKRPFFFIFRRKSMFFKKSQNFHSFL